MNTDAGYKMKSYKDLEIYQMSLQLPKFEMYEEGVQIRRSAKSAVVNND